MNKAIARERRVAPLPSLLIEPILRAALLEDLGRAGDLTTDAIVGVEDRAKGRIVARQAGRIAGLDAATSAFTLLDANVVVEVCNGDGSDVEAGATLAIVSGSARALLTGERTMLNLLGHLCGVATATRELVTKVAGTRARIACTRKTTPGLRSLEKYAVRVGGGSSHRYGLDDAALIKDNHVIAAGGLSRAIELVRNSVGHLVKIEVEVDTLEQLQEVLAMGVDVILLDNMSLDMLREAVAITAGRAVLEASGSISAKNVAETARTGVDLISSGWITHSAPSLDIGLDFD
ncbi:MAG TPA: carboxylating nicotinate-nucleotide diphosphorylase [Candidatus Baltobacteraceae bacterium]|jgi:nicotinate-nucleotide pyrophosphorylase (carboxylating)|nr:carboxylating nicotinate-nucleotide diphosphorylase [Candidatus Baltobacteraceae bacterium]